VVVAGAFVAGLLNPKLNGDDPPKLRDIFWTKGKLFSVTKSVKVIKKLDERLLNLKIWFENYLKD
jgi:hypothetical protein